MPPVYDPDTAIWDDDENGDYIVVGSEPPSIWEQTVLAFVAGESLA